MNETTKKILEVALGVAVLAGLGAAGYFAWQKYGEPTVTAPAPTPLTKEEASRADLGTELYEQSQNPLQDKLPDGVAPVPNPVQDLYKNPFQ